MEKPTMEAKLVKQPSCCFLCGTIKTYTFLKVTLPVVGNTSPIYELLFCLPCAKELACLIKEVASA